MAAVSTPTPAGNSTAGIEPTHETAFRVYIENPDGTAAPLGLPVNQQSADEMVDKFHGVEGLHAEDCPDYQPRRAVVRRVSMVVMICETETNAEGGDA